MIKFGADTSGWSVEVLGTTLLRIAVVRIVIGTLWITGTERVELGNFGDCRSVGEGISELRINYGPGYRIYFGQLGTTIVLLLCGGDKSTQQEDITKAKEYWEEYEKRENAN
ncbi:type II toxin-antitoxin system RelE/ParE family toxin [Argonema galeatum]|uniref:type II toxin-antitoxin system RelE/ParE family toxin n=1 Tax=Argonema galeatum TaxID=2942762 RepID=UPI0020112280|nr:type II toxin-antitoxin system RelE/ParE family toxin [Argonema galeatum]MCL1468331.1 hypothetical protein [Argonema galeatum A003/A1]